jgi:hypothetical protein
VNNLLVNILGIASGNRQGNAVRPEGREHSRSRSWSQNRGHKSHGRKHGKNNHR